MGADLSLVLGLFLMALSLPSILSARADLRPPWVGALIALTGLWFAAHAWALKPGGYDGESAVMAVYHVLAQIIP